MRRFQLAQRSAERVYVVQHDHNPMMFLRAGADGDPSWTLNQVQARRFTSEHFALRYISNWLNGKGYALPLVVPTKRAA